MIKPTDSKKFARNVGLIFAVSMVGALVMAPVVLVASAGFAVKDWLTK